MPLAKDNRASMRPPPPPYSTISSTGVSPSSSPNKSIRSGEISGPPPRSRSRSSYQQSSSGGRDQNHNGNMLLLPQTLDGSGEGSPNKSGSRSPSARRSSLASSPSGSPSTRRATLYEDRRRHQPHGPSSQSMTPKSSRRGTPGKELEYISWSPGTRNMVLEAMDGDDRERSRPASPQRSYFLPKSPPGGKPKSLDGRVPPDADSSAAPSLGFPARPASPSITSDNALDLFNADPRATSPTRERTRRADKFRDSRAATNGSGPSSSSVSSKSQLFPDDRRTRGKSQTEDAQGEDRTHNNESHNIMVLPMDQVRKSPLSGHAIVRSASRKDNDDASPENKAAADQSKPDEFANATLDEGLKTSSKGPVAKDQGGYIDFSVPAPAGSPTERRGRRKPPPVIENDELGMIPPPPTSKTSPLASPKIVTRGSSRSQVPQIKTSAPPEETAKKSKRDEPFKLEGSLFGGRGAAHSVSNAQKQIEKAKTKDRRRPDKRPEPITIPKPKRGSKKEERDVPRRVPSKKPNLNDVKVTSEERGERPSSGLLGLGAIFGFRAASVSGKSDKLAVPGEESNWQRFGAATPTAASSVDPDELRNVDGKSEGKVEKEAEAEPDTKVEEAAAVVAAEETTPKVDKGKGKAPSEAAEEEEEEGEAEETEESAAETDDTSHPVARRLAPKASFATGISGTTADYEDTQDWKTELSGADSRISLVDDEGKPIDATITPSASNEADTSLIGLVGGLSSGLYGWVTGSGTPNKDKAATKDAMPSSGSKASSLTIGDKAKADDAVAPEASTSATTEPVTNEAESESAQDDVDDADGAKTVTGVAVASAAGAVAVAEGAKETTEPAAAAEPEAAGETEAAAAGYDANEDAASVPSGEPPSYTDVTKRPSTSRKSTEPKAAKESRRSYFRSGKRQSKAEPVGKAKEDAPKPERRPSNQAKSRAAPVGKKPPYQRRGTGSTSGRPATDQRSSAPTFGRSAKRATRSRRDSAPAEERPSPRQRASAREDAIPEEGQEQAKKRFSLAFWGRKSSTPAAPKEPPPPKGPNRLSVALGNAGTAAKKSATSASTATKSSVSNAGKAVRSTTTNAAAATGEAVKKGGTAVNDFSMRGIISMMNFTDNLLGAEVAPPDEDSAAKRRTVAFSDDKAAGAGAIKKPRPEFWKRVTVSNVDILELRRQGDRNTKPVTIAATVKDPRKSAMKRPADKVTKADTPADLDQSVVEEGLTFTVGQAAEGSHIQAGKAIESEHVGIVDVVEDVETDGPVASGSGVQVDAGVNEKPPTDDAGPSLASRIIGYFPAPGGLVPIPSDEQTPALDSDHHSVHDAVVGDKATSSNQVSGDTPSEIEPPTPAFSTSHGQGSSSNLTTPTKANFGLPKSMSSTALSSPGKGVSSSPTATRDPNKVFSSEEYNTGPDFISGRAY